MASLICVGAFLALFFLGVPIVLSMYAPAIVYFLTSGFPLEIIGTKALYSLSSYTLVACPLFILVGEMMGSVGVARRIFDIADKLVGWIPGGLAQVNIVASLIFAGMSGSALADVGGLGKIEMDAMDEKGFPPAFSGAVTVASSTLGPIFPPSIPMLLFAAVASASPVKCLIAGMVPAIICAALMMILTAFIALRRNFPRRTEKMSFHEFVESLRGSVLALLIPVILIVGMLTGVFTPTELSAFSCLMVIIVSILYGDFSLESMKGSVVAAIDTIASILMIFPAASLYTLVLTWNRTPEMFANFMLGISENLYSILLLVNIMLLIVGMFMGNTEAILLLVPILAPLLTGMGMDIVQIAIMVVFNLMIGLITPPFAMSLYLGADVAGVSVKALLIEILPYFIPLIVTLLIITYCPPVALWIPNML